jgi:hypothetical protein
MARREEVSSLEVLDRREPPAWRAAIEARELLQAFRDEYPVAWGDHGGVFAGELRKEQWPEAAVQLFSNAYRIIDTLLSAVDERQGDRSEQNKI